MRHLILLCKMRPSLQQEILKIIPAPSSRDGLVAAGSRTEESHKVRFTLAAVPNNRHATLMVNDHVRPPPRPEVLVSYPMDTLPTSPTVAVFVAGPSGLAAARKLIEAGFKVTVFERNSGSRGTWYETSAY